MRRHNLIFSVAAVGWLLLACPTAADELDVADFVELTIARLEQAEETWSAEGRSPTQAEDDALFETYGTTSEYYYERASELRRQVEAYLEDHPELRRRIEALSESIREWIEEAERVS